MGCLKYGESDTMETTLCASIGRFDVGMILGLKLIAVGIALDLDNDEENYNFSLTIALGLVSFNLCWRKPQAS